MNLLQERMTIRTKNQATEITIWDLHKYFYAVPHWKIYIIQWFQEVELQEKIKQTQQ